MKMNFLEVLEMGFKEICSPSGKFALFQEKVTFPEAHQVLFNGYLLVDWIDNYFKVCSKFQGELVVTEADEDYEGLVHLHSIQHCCAYDD